MRHEAQSTLTALTPIRIAAVALEGPAHSDDAFQLLWKAHATSMATVAVGVCRTYTLAGKTLSHLDCEALVQHVVLQHKANALAGGLAVGLAVHTHCSGSGSGSGRAAAAAAAASTAASTAATTTAATATATALAVVSGSINRSGGGQHPRQHCTVTTRDAASRPVQLHSVIFRCGAFRCGVERATGTALHMQRLRSNVWVGLSKFS